MTLKRNKAGNLVLPKQKQLPDKVWITVQCTRALRNTVTKIAERHGLNISRYIRKKLEELVESANKGQIEKMVLNNNIASCPHCGEILDVSNNLT